jgi:hypothetical protein
MTNYLLSFRLIFSLILSFVVDWVALTEWLLRHRSLTHKQYRIVPPDGQISLCVVGVLEGIRHFNPKAVL